MKPFLPILCIALALAACTPESMVSPVSPEPETIPVRTLELSSASLSLHPGDKVSLTATVVPSDATDVDLDWSSSDGAVATVSQAGEVAALSVGEAVITASCGGRKAECLVTVSLEYIPVSSVTLDRTGTDLLAGESLLLEATVSPSDATEKEVTWTSSDTEVATVENGLVTALSAGEAVITAAAGGCSATCLVKVTMPFSYGGMCMEAVSVGTISISNPNRLTIEYKVADGDWTSASSATISISAEAGEKVWFRGENETYTGGNGDDGYIPTVFSCGGGDFYLSGNLMSLICGDDYASCTGLTGEFAFFKLFDGNNHLLNHPERDIELPATGLSPSCYRNMFYGCGGLTRAPQLPARVLTEACYASMFAYCTSLKTFPEMAAEEMDYMSCTWMMMGSGIEEAPELPAMKLAESCYQFMFMECPNLRKAMPTLPATELAPKCYSGMFQRSDKLENAPELPATDLKYECYSHMFNGCNALTKAPELPATTLAVACYQRMFGNSGLTEAPKLPAMDLEVMCYQYMFEGALHLEKAPVLPASQLEPWCYANMFHGCSSLNYVNAAFITKPSTSYTANWLDGVADRGLFVKSPDAEWDVTGPHGVPEGWTIEQ